MARRAGCDRNPVCDGARQGRADADAGDGPEACAVDTSQWDDSTFDLAGVTDWELKRYFEII